MKKIKILILALSVMMLAVSCSSGDDTKGEDQNKDTEQKNTDDKKNPGDLDNDNGDNSDRLNLLVGTWKSELMEVCAGGEAGAGYEISYEQYGTCTYIFNTDKTGSEILKGERTEYSDNYPESKKDVDLIDEETNFTYEIEGTSIKFIFQDEDHGDTAVAGSYEITGNKLSLYTETGEKLELTRQ
ncbi:MAG: hypothetical protein KBT11_09595 [Treponema sp.]|nr:hypothetical protein [Candidatus Treponema equifaecale]